MNSILKKQFIFQFAIISISFLLLGVGVTSVFVKTFINQKRDVLVEQGEEISKLIKNFYYLGGYFNTKELSNEINILDKYLDASLIYVNEDYEITIISSKIDSAWLGKTLEIKQNDKKPNSFKNKQYFSFTGNMGGIFDEEVFTVGYPVIVNNYKIGIIFMNTSMSSIINTIKEVYEKIVFISLLVIAISFIFIYIFSRKITLPLIEINKTAKIIASGNLNKRIQIKSKDEIGQLASSFNEMTESLSQQEKKRTEFISNISHDLRSPLTSIKGFLQAILDKTIPPENQERYLKIVLEEVERLISLSNNILEINKLHLNSELNYTEFNINEVIRLSIINLETRIIDKNINVNVSFSEENTFVKADIDKIHRVIYNLLDNSIKFTNEGGQIFIETSLTEENVIISIKDTGCGISKENQKKIFDKFYKEDSSRGENKNGSGLGLSIVKDFILAHNQKIAVKSELNKGSEFIFTLERV